jgi:uncharacterized protein YecE (DUF72 family)
VTTAPRVAVGTCGFSYSDWIGPVYPPGTKPGEMLASYARRFPTVEIDATYYRVPSAATFASMAARTPPEFRFSAKLPGAATHLPPPGTATVHDDVRLFRHNVQPLVDAGKFACALAQFPNGFRPTDATRGYLAYLRAALDDVPLVAEFRHRDWQTGETLTLLRELGIGLANVDEPQFKTLMRAGSDVTSSIAYVRFHGRNAATWWNGTNETRYDYLYAPDELEPWVERIVDIAANDDVREIFAYFNNHRQGQAVRNAEMLEAMIAEHLEQLVVRAQPPDGPPPETLELPLFGERD